MGKPRTHADFYGMCWEEQMLRDLRGRHRRKRWARRLRGAGILLAYAGMAAGIAALRWPALAHWPLTVALLGVPALLLGAQALGRR